MEVVGLNEENIKSISSIKNEDLWTLEYRLESFNLFNDISLPSFGPKIDIDFDKIKSAAPKWYMGYSDNTNFTFLSTVLADTAAIYGPCAPAFGREPWHDSVSDALKIMTGDLTGVTGYDKWEKEEYEVEEGEEVDPIHTPSGQDVSDYADVDVIITYEYPSDDIDYYDNGGIYIDHKTNLVYFWLEN